MSKDERIRESIRLISDFPITYELTKQDGKDG